MNLPSGPVTANGVISVVEALKVARVMNWPLFTNKTFEGKGKLRRSEKIEAEVMKGRQKEALAPVKKGRQQKRK